MQLKFYSQLKYGQNHGNQTTIADHVEADSEVRLLRKGSEGYRPEFCGESVLRRMSIGKNRGSREEFVSPLVEGLR